MATVSIHPSVDNGVKKGAAGFAGGTLQCNCASDKVEVKVDGNVAHTVNFMQGAITIVMALALSFLATIFPAWRASKLDPVQALRYE